MSNFYYRKGELKVVETFTDLDVEFPTIKPLDEIFIKDTKRKVYWNGNEWEFTSSSLPSIKIDCIFLSLSEGVYKGDFSIPEGFKVISILLYDYDCTDTDSCGCYFKDFNYKLENNKVVLIDTWLTSLFNRKSKLYLRLEYYYL
jgi:hypothetical protein